MQGLQEIWDIENRTHAWSTSGYLGAISSGQTTCGLLIGSSVAIGLRVGRNKACLPLEDTAARDFAVEQVGDLYEDFLKRFGSTECKALTSCDFSKAEDQSRYIEDEIYKEKCWEYFNFVMNRFCGLLKK